MVGDVVIVLHQTGVCIEGRAEIAAYVGLGSTFYGKNGVSVGTSQSRPPAKLQYEPQIHTQYITVMLYVPLNTVFWPDWYPRKVRSPHKTSNPVVGAHAVLLDSAHTAAICWASCWPSCKKDFNAGHDAPVLPDHKTRN